jgi:hypothetical protein
MKTKLQNSLAAILLSLGLLFSWQTPVLARPAQTLTSVRAWVSNTAPKQNSKVTAYCEAKDQSNKPIQGATCSFTWNYKTISHTMGTVTNKKGQGSTMRNISRATKGYPVDIDVTVSYGGVTKTTATSFIPK